MEMAKQIDAEMDKSEYRPPNRNCTSSGSQASLGANPLRHDLVRGVSVEGRLRSQGGAIAEKTPAPCSLSRFPIISTVTWDNKASLLLLYHPNSDGAAVIDCVWHGPGFDL
eukprot:COSAG01_NODE_15751_length_1303_cov_2.601329_2_plen_111_part_00